MDFLDDGDVPVFAAGAQHSSLEAHHVAQLDGAAGGVSVLLGAGRPHVAVAHVGVHRFADLLPSGGGPPGALAHAVRVDRGHGHAAGVDVDAGAIGDQGRAEVADGGSGRGRA